MKKILLILILFLSSIIIFATTYQSQITGNWDIATTWDLGVPDGSKENVIIIKTGTIVNANALNFSKATQIIIENGAELIIGTTLTIDIDIASANKDFTLTVLDGGKLTINGNFTAGKDAKLTIDGEATINGDLLLGQNAIITVDASIPSSGGILNVNGDLLAGAGSVILGIGDVNVIGIVKPNSMASDPQLPIELTYFKAYSTQNNVVLTWETASELNNDYFTIELSIDGVAYKSIATINGAGTSMIPLTYTVKSPLNGVSYYRLKQTDYDGKFEVFNPVSVITSHLNENIKYNVYDISGRFIGYEKIENLPRGVFLIKNGDELKKIIH